MPPGSSDSRRSVAGDGSAESLERLVRETQSRVLELTGDILRDPELAADAAQDVYVKILRQVREGGDVPGAAFVYRTATLVARARLRAESRRAGKERAAALLPSATADPPSRDDPLDLRDALPRLPGPLRDCLRLRYFRGLSVGEIARAIGRSRRTVHVRLRRARVRLRARLRRGGGSHLVS